ncbi:Inositol polyphosphate multikinase [Termitomyces sp. T112]|nr:Inositol polyphosphate multikinase [Termitomyces sp. T112]
MNTNATSASQPHPFRVIGHAGMRTTPDGSLIIKPSFPAELRFYETLMMDPYIAVMRPFVPRFLGTLPGNSGLADDAAQLSGISIPPGRTEFIILENLCNAFSKPNTLDIKLGTVFHDDKTDPAKVLRMQRTSRETTSLRTGVRLTEFQVYDTKTSQPVCTPKSYGKAIKESELAKGFAQCFPVYGEPSSSTLGLPRRLLVPILRGIRESVARIREIYSSLEMRIVGGSLVIMYEADWCLAEEGLRRHSLQPLDEHRESGVRRLPYLVKIVDFAHTRVGRGLGPDEGVLLGLNTMLKLLDGRITELSYP